MDEQELKYLKSLLLRRRREIYDRLQGLESDWDALSERDIESEEEAQKADLTTLFHQLGEREKREIEEIDLALTKLAAASFGICEKFRKPIALERLEVIPATRFCKQCASRQRR
jgi:RNA polymerase-binding transcription factor DksA